MKQVKKIPLFLYGMFLLLCNASVFWGIKWGNQIAIIFIIVSVGIVFVKKRIYLPNLKKSAFIAGLFLLVNLLNIRSGVNWFSATLFIGEIIAISIVQSYINPKELHKVLANCMLIISIVSLVSFFIRETNSALLNPFIYREAIHGSKYKYVYTIWHTFGWNVDFHRNAGPYWEAGMFACYLAIALAIVEFEDGIFENEKKRFFAKSILIATILSTLSTTGYLSIILYFVILVIRIPNIGKKNICKKLLLGVAVIFIASIVFNTSVVQDKLFTTNSSMTKRTEDIVGGLKLIKENPILGLGFRSDLSRKLEIVYGSGNSANGLIQGCYRMGLLVFTILLYSYYKGLTVVMNKKNAGLTFLLLMFLFASEPMQIFLVVLSLAFLREEKKKDKQEELERNLDVQ